MNLNIIYQPNETAEKLHELLKSNWNDAVHYQSTLDGVPYWFMEIPDPESRIRRVINTPAAIRLCRDEDALYRIMGANNIHSGPKGDETVNRSYQVLVCDHEIISIKVNTFLKNNEKARYIREIENTKVAELARRTISLMGLDLGLVNLDFTARRRFKVVSVESSPEIREKDLNRIIEKLKHVYSLDTIISLRDVKLGADPEFMLANSKSGRMVSASQFFPRDGQIGCDNIRVPNRQQRPVAEVRPTPSCCPMDLTSNIKKSLEQASRLAPYRNVKWVAGSQPFSGFSIGGHIHFSNIKLDAALLRALDNYVGITSFLLENPATAVRRRRKYGYLGDYRLKNHGGFEYRTPASWLVSQEITTAMLCLAKIVASRYYQLGKNYLNNPEAQNAFYKGDQAYFRAIFPEIWSDLQMIDLYNEYADALRVIPRMVAAESCWDESQDIRKSWKLSGGGKREYVTGPNADGGSSNATSSTATVRSTAQVSRAAVTRQRQVIRSADSNVSLSYRTPSVRNNVRPSSTIRQGNNSLSQGRLSVSSPARRTRINNR